MNRYEREAEATRAAVQFVRELSLSEVGPGHMIDGTGELKQCPCSSCAETYHEPRRQALLAEIRERVREFSRQRSSEAVSPSRIPPITTIRV